MDFVRKSKNVDPNDVPLSPITPSKRREVVEEKEEEPLLFELPVT